MRETQRADRATLTSPSGRRADRFFRSGAALFGLAVVVILVAAIAQLAVSSAGTWRALGPGFVVGDTWDVGTGVFGALPFIVGTAATAALAMLLAVPLGVLAAIFLAEVAPRSLAAPLVILIELIAAIPSVVIGLWGMLVLTPLIRDTLETWASETFGEAIPWLAGPPIGSDLFAASLVLAIMVVPTVVSISREVILAVPRDLREAHAGLGATRWETIGSVVLPAARSGILGASILALGRAMGETMAVTMMVGNADRIPGSLFDQTQTIASKIATTFTEAGSPEEQQALLALALVLMAMTLGMGALARLLVGRTSRTLRGA